MRIDLCFVAIIILSVSCKPSDTRFELIKAEDTGVDFVNELIPSTDLNIFNYLYFFNGGGVASGDLNNDGFPDLIFTSNQGSSKLYLNQKDFQFTDISHVLGQTERTNKWTTGVSLADVNSDGRLDIYINEVGSYLKIEGENKLYINQGNNESGVPQFVESAKKYGLDLIGFSTQSAFFDYDLDGDLDMFQLNHSVHSNGTFVKSDLRYKTHPLAGDKLMRNEEGYFVDVTESSGIFSSALGYGLGLAITDINDDSYPDIYVGNDFHENDYFYINQGDGTFKERLEEMVQHTSRFSMGNDIADINNDGLLDIVSLDMLPRDYDKLQASAGEDRFEVFRYKLRYGYNHQYARNTLQLNRGNGKFSDIGIYADIHATDWSWSSLFADFDHDGYSDLFIANGIKGRTNDMDYINFISNDAIQYRLEGDLSSEELELTNKMPVVRIPNYAFKNRGDLTFKDVSKEWGLSQSTFSNGAVYSDLDLDGDMDLVINNIDQTASIYRNKTMQEDAKARYLKVRFVSNSTNTYGIGSKLEFKIGNEIITRENYPVRGFQSCVDPIIHIGLKEISSIDELRLSWPTKGVAILNNVALDQTLIVSDSLFSENVVAEDLEKESLFRDISDDLDLTYKHRENSFVDFNRERLIPHMISREGPAFTSGDLNNDGLTDFFVGGAKTFNSFLFFQNADGSFEQRIFEEDSTYEDVDARLVDFNEDEFLDLLVLSGGNEFRGESVYREPRLYMNQGKGSFRKSPAFKDVKLTGSVIALADYDTDGDIDIFFGARAEPWAYGLPPKSYFVRNNNGQFEVDTVFENLGMKLGLVTGAEWADLDGNGWVDLVVASEWSSIKVIYLDETGYSMKELDSGLWNTLSVQDMDGDGRMDIIAGNLGLNSKFRASSSDPLRMYVSDFDGNGQVEQIITYAEKGKEFLFADRDDLTDRLSYLKKKYPTYQAFAKAGFTDVFTNKDIESALKYEINEMKSCIYFNDDRDQFTKVPLPDMAQFSPIRTILISDFTSDGNLDMLVAGNQSGASIQRGRYDASYGDLLQFEGRIISYMNNSSHGLYATGVVRKLELMEVNRKKVVVAIRNNDPLAFYEVVNN